MCLPGLPWPWAGHLGRDRRVRPEPGCPGGGPGGHIQWARCSCVHTCSCSFCDTGPSWTGQAASSELSSLVFRGLRVRFLLTEATGGLKQRVRGDCPDVTRACRGGPVDCGELSSLPGLHSLAAMALPPRCDSLTSGLRVGVSQGGERPLPGAHTGIGDDWSRAAVLWTHHHLRTQR